MNEQDLTVGNAQTLAIQRLNGHIEAGTLIRGRWTGTDEQGRHLACLLAAMVPECGKEQMASVCPAELMPQWLAQLTPWIDDAGSDAAWPGVVRRYAAVAARWHALSAEEWRRLDYAVRALCVREAMRHTPDATVISVCGRAATLCEAAASGATIDVAETAAAPPTAPPPPPPSR